MLQKAERFSLISDREAGEKGGKALWMEREFHLDSTGLIFFFFKSLSKPKRTANQNWPPSCCRPQSLALNKLLIKRRGGKPSLNTSPERRLYQNLFL